MARNMGPARNLSPHPSEKGSIIKNNGQYGENAAYDEGLNSHGQQAGEHLDRGLKARHVAMISIGGVIGTGLFLGTANALRHGGPLGLWLGYIVMSSICFATMMSVGEMSSYLPIPGGHIRLADRFVNPAFSFAMGWNYAYNWLLVLPAELSAAAVLISFWSPINGAVWISICLIAVVAINFLGVRAYGETEFWFCSIKVVTIVGLIILSFAIDLGAGDQGRLGFRYWGEPYGPFRQFEDIPGPKGRFLGFFAVLIQASFSFIGTEIVAMCAGEAKNPRRNIPRAIKSVWIRILGFYILGTLAISVVCPSNHPDLKLGSTAAKSPFVIAIKAAGIKGLPSVINAALVTSATSAASSDLYTASRALYSLALNQHAPRILARTTKNGLPWVALAFSTCFGFLAYMGTAAGAGKVFGWFSNLTALCGLLTWFGINVTYIRFRKGLDLQNFDRAQLPFRSPGGVYLAYYAIAVILTVCVFNGFDVFLRGNWNVATFVTSYLPLPMFFILYAGYRFHSKVPVRPLRELDYVTGVQEIIDAEEPEDANGPWQTLKAKFAGSRHSH